MSYDKFVVFLCYVVALKLVTFTYMKRSLSVDVGTVDVYFVVVQESNHIMYVSMLDSVEQDV